VNNLLNELMGKKVYVHSNAGGTEKAEIGVLEAFDGTFLRVRKGEAEVVFYNLQLVRLVKQF